MDIMRPKAAGAAPEKYASPRDSLQHGELQRSFGLTTFQRWRMTRIPVVESPFRTAGKRVRMRATEPCTLCDRSVHNVDRMSERERRNFMSSCSGKVCVAYTVKIPVRHRGLAVASLAAIAVIALPAAADSPSEQAETPGESLADLPHCDVYLEEVIVGGVAHGDQAEWADDGTDAPRELPTMEDDGR